MKPITDLTREHLSPIKLIAFDSDGVLAQKGTEIHQDGGFYSQQTYLINPEIIAKLNELKNYYHIVINSGRNSLYLTQIYQDILWDNITIISEIGVFLTGSGYMVQTDVLDNYELSVSKTIRQKLTALIGDPRIEGLEPKQFLTTLHCKEAVPEVEKIVIESDPENKFYCWWNEEAYDINPKKFTKLSALNKLISLKGFLPENIITVGNGINDSDLTSGSTINISTDPIHLKTDDYFVEGEHSGAITILDHLLKLLHE
jgi:hydroxymethylpyrimidine pyrophosphatase-like HAD family hydrolase